MIHVPFDATLWALADDRANQTRVYAGSNRGAAANQIGALGEVVFEDYLQRQGIAFRPLHTTRADLLVRGRTCDIKCKDRTATPQPNYECSIPLYNHKHQRPAIYVFVSLLRNGPRDGQDMRRFVGAYLVGWCRDRDLAGGITRKAGEVDPANGTRFWTDCINLRVDQLRHFRTEG